LAVRVDTAGMRVTIYAGSGYMQDGRYLAAALGALKQFTSRRVQINVTTKIKEIGEKQDWLFWLSPAPLPFAGMAGHVLRYEPGKAVVVDTWLRGESGVEIGKEIEGGARYAAEWEDGYGRVLLGREGMGRGVVYHFFSRCDPGWNGLVWSRSFPVLLSRLLFDGGLDSVADRRVLDPAQVVPMRRPVERDRDRIGKTGGRLTDPGKTGGRLPDPGRTGGTLVDLGPVCWGLLLLLFIMERVAAIVTAPDKRSY
jgi:hypothetical protein